MSQTEKMLAGLSAGRETEMYYRVLDFERTKIKIVVVGTQSISLSRTLKYLSSVVLDESWSESMWSKKRTRCK